jgi:TonB family protein
VGIRQRRSNGSRYFLVSLVLHGLVVMLLGLSGLSFRKSPAGGDDAREDGRHTFQVIEVPDNIPPEKPVDPTDLVSDRPQRAADRDLDDTDDSPLPLSEGDIETREFPRAADEVALAHDEAEASDPEQRRLPVELEAWDLGEKSLLDESAGHPFDGAHPAGVGQAGEPARFRNLDSGAERYGGLSFNTYEWDFAPYMLAMKHAIESHLFPPYAFTHMGIVSGTNVVHFTVLPNGTIRDLEILGSDAHFSLDRTSVRAIEASVPFLPLPSDFPEECLEVTAHFSYVILGKN